MNIVFKETIREPGQMMVGPERYILFGLAAACRGAGTHAIEIGTLGGGTTSNLARLLPGHTVITVSMPKDAVPLLDSEPSDADYFGIAPTFDDDVRDRITHFFLDSANFPPLVHAVGFAFIDGGHSTAYVKNDFEKILPHCVDGAIVAFHDYGTDNSCGITSVRIAVDELAEKYPEHKWTTCEGISLAWVIIRK